MNLKWTRYWIGLFGDKTDELMSLYNPELERSIWNVAPVMRQLGVMK